MVSPSQYISGASAINPLIAFYDIHERREERKGKEEKKGNHQNKQTCSCTQMFVWVVIILPPLISETFLMI
jgi:hypothetical protein